MRYTDKFTVIATCPENSNEAIERAELVGSNVSKAIEDLKAALANDPIMEDESGDKAIEAFRDLQNSVNTAAAFLEWFGDCPEYNQFFDGLIKGQS